MINISQAELTVSSQKGSAQPIKIEVHQKLRRLKPGKAIRVKL